MQKLTLLVLFGLLVGCTNVNRNDSEKKIDEDALFREFSNKMQKRQLPIILHCGLPDGPGSDNVSVADFEKYQKYIPRKVDVIYGLIHNNAGFKSIIFGMVGDNIYPLFFTYDNMGNKIDSLNLILKACGAADDTQIPNSFITIDENLNIYLVDTTMFIHYPNNSKDYLIDSVTITKEDYTINNQGHIIKK